MISFARSATVSIGLAGLVLVAATLTVLAAPVAAQEDIDAQRVDVTVTEDGAIERMEVSWGLDDEAYAEFETYAETEGYERVEDWFESAYETQEWIGDSAVTATDVDGGYVLSIELVDVETDEEPQVDVEADGDTVVYEEFDVPDPADEPAISEATYAVTMPGEITESNADEVDGEVATWHLHEEHASELFVEATLGDEGATDATGEDDASDGDDDSEGTDEDDGDGMPGFGPIAAIAGSGAGAYLYARSRLDGESSTSGDAQRRDSSGVETEDERIEDDE